MKLENAYIVRKWREYVGPEDERLKAEDARICRIALIVLMAGICALIVFDYQYNQILWVRGISDTPVFLSGLGSAMFVLLVAVCATSLIAQIRKGYTDTHRFGQADSFPAGYFALISGIAAASTALLIGIMRCGIELTLVDASEVYWMANFFVGLVYGGVIFTLTCVFFYAAYRSAKRNRLKAEAELED